MIGSFSLSFCHNSCSTSRTLHSGRACGNAQKGHLEETGMNLDPSDENCQPETHTDLNETCL